jgi:hypothetical protein
MIWVYFQDYSFQFLEWQGLWEVIYFFIKKGFLSGFLFSLKIDMWIIFTILFGIGTIGFVFFLLLGTPDANNKPKKKVLIILMN